MIESVYCTLHKKLSRYPKKQALPFKILHKLNLVPPHIVLEFYLTLCTTHAVSSKDLLNTYGLAQKTLPDGILYL